MLTHPRGTHLVVMDEFASPGLRAMVTKVRS